MVEMEHKDRNFGNFGRNDNSRHGTQHSANNISGRQFDYTQVASTSYEANNASLPKGQAFTEKEYRQILTLLNKEVQETKQVNMIGTFDIIICKISNVVTRDWIVYSRAST